MKYEIKTAREEENAATQRVRDGRRRSSPSSFGGDENRPDRYPGLILRYQRSVSAMKSSMSSSQ